jgi:hypothetical protein
MQVHDQAALPPGAEISYTQWIESWVGLRAGVDAVKKGKSLAPARNQTLAFKLVARFYTDWGICNTNRVIIASLWFSCYSTIIFLGRIYEWDDTSHVFCGLDGSKGRGRIRENIGHNSGAKCSIEELWFSVNANCFVKKYLHTKN